MELASHLSDTVRTMPMYVKKCIFLRCFCLYHSKLEVVLQLLMSSKPCGNLSENLTEHHISKMNHDHGNLLNSIKMKLTNFLGKLKVLDSLFLSKLKLKIPIFKSFKSGLHTMICFFTEII